MVFLKKSGKLLGLALAVGIMGCMSLAQAAEDPACDPTFMTTLKQKGWMEAQREFMLAGSIISKPDSVLALSCFDATDVPVSFSNSSSGLNTINNRADTFLNSSFNHALGGGRYGGSNTRSGCGKIASLWSSAMCDNVSISKIKTLTEISTGEIRTAPSTCGSTGSGWSTYLDNLAEPGANAPYDAMNLFLGITAPFSALTAGSNCSAGIKTGVKVGDPDSGPPEIICGNPGCTSNGEATPKCCKATINADGTVSYSNCST